MQPAHAFVLEETLDKLKKICIRHKIEVNVNASGHLALWAGIETGDVAIDDIRPVDVPNAVDALQDFRKSGWKAA